MKGLLILVLALVGAVSVSAAVRRQNRHLVRIAESAEMEMQVEQAIQSWLSYNYEFTNTFKDFLLNPVNQIPSKAVDPIMRILAIRNARMEAAIGLVSQDSPDVLPTLKKVLNKMICIHKAAFPEIKDEKDAIGLLFALPGANGGQDEAVWTKAFEKNSAWINFDNDRWGAFLNKEDKLDGHVANVKRVLTSGNLRELLHLIARASLYGESKAIDDASKISAVAPHSFRHALVELHNNELKAKNAFRSCEFNREYLASQWKNNFKGGKTLINPILTSSVLDARAPRAPGFRSPRFPDEKNKFAPSKQTPRSRLTPNLLKALGMAPLSDQEKKFVKEFSHWNEGADNRVPFGVGGNVWVVPRGVPDNKQWRDAMDNDGLNVDAGPSGTTDEIIQFGDYTSVSRDRAGVCALRDAAFAQMLLQVHHSYAEICQGANDGKRNIPQWNFKRPYDALVKCPGRWDRAYKKFLDLENDKLPVVQALIKSDFGTVPADTTDTKHIRRIVFEKSKESPADLKYVEKYLCPIRVAEFPGGLEMRKIMCGDKH